MGEWTLPPNVTVYEGLKDISLITFVPTVRQSRRSDVLVVVLLLIALAGAAWLIWYSLTTPYKPPVPRVWHQFVLASGLNGSCYPVRGTRWYAC